MVTNMVSPNPYSCNLNLNSGARAQNQGCSGLKLSRRDGLHQRRAAMHVTTNSRQTSLTAESVLERFRCKKQPAHSGDVACHIHLDVDVGTEVDQSLDQLGRPTPKSCSTEECSRKIQPGRGSLHHQLLYRCCGSESRCILVAGETQKVPG